VGGYRNAGRIAVLGSETTYQAISATARDSQWGEQRRARQDTIAMAVGIPPVLLRMSEATFANAEQARAELWEGTLQPRMSRVAAMVTRRLVPMLTDEPLVAQFDFSDIKALGENVREQVDTAPYVSVPSVREVGVVEPGPGPARTTATVDAAAVGSSDWPAAHHGQKTSPVPRPAKTSSGMPLPQATQGRLLIGRPPASASKAAFDGAYGTAPSTCCP
jgi:hypothetical protein